MTVSFDIPKADAKTITQIINRAVELSPDHGWTPDDRLSLVMDLTATHANGCPMDFDRLLEADDFNFSHDVFGIMRHIDRATGELGDHFLPRFASKVTS